MSVPAVVSRDGQGLLYLSFRSASFQWKDEEDHVAVSLEYLNEGGANVILTVHLLNGQTGPLTNLIRGKLLRLRKHGIDDLSTVDQLEALETYFVPLFQHDQVIQSDLVRLTRPFLDTVQNQLPLMPRSSRRAQDQIASHESHGLFVSDMRHWSADDNHSVLQFKPKWLSQSPNAPAHSRRCRTCALRALRVSQGATTASDEQDICPLELTSENAGDRAGAGRRLTRNKRLIQWFVDDSESLLGTLKHRQNQFDPDGVLHLSGTGCVKKGKVQDMCKAMTLRDCTVYLRIKAEGDAVEAKLGDLDLKHSDKIGKWAGLEKALISGGWYENTESDGVRVTERVCMLSKQGI